MAFERSAVPPAARPRSILLHSAAKPIFFVASALPFLWLTRGAFANTLGVNPAETLMRATGDWTLRFLCITLAITPLRHWLGEPALVRFRRMTGLYAFFYGCVHFLCYSWLDMGFDLEAIIRDIPKRPFVLVGSLGLVLMAPLAATSFSGAIRALGAQRWKLLHRLVYGVALLGLLHFYWMRSAKNNFAEVTIYAAVIFALLGWRLYAALSRRITRHGGAT